MTCESNFVVQGSAPNGTALNCAPRVRSCSVARKGPGITTLSDHNIEKYQPPYNYSIRTGWFYSTTIFLACTHCLARMIAVKKYEIILPF